MGEALSPGRLLELSRARAAQFTSKGIQMNRLLASVIRSALLLMALFALVQPAHSAPGDIYLEFYGSPESATSPGHAFMCIALHLSAGVKEDCYGFYPQDISQLLNGKGKVESELSRADNRFKSVTVSSRHKISDAQRRAALGELKRYAGEKYDIIVNNCGDMTLDVAKAAGLKTPSRGEFKRPVTFVERLRDLNRGS